MKYRIVYVKDVEFGAVAHEFFAVDDNDARQMAKEEIRLLKRKHGRSILIRRLECVEPQSKMTEKVRSVSMK